MSDEILHWRVYYGDGSTVDNTQSSIFELPTVNIQAIVQRDPEVGRIVLNRWDYYCWRGDDLLFYGSELGGFWDYLFNYPAAKHILFGRTMPTAEYQAILYKAKKDEYFIKQYLEPFIETTRRR